MITKQLYFDIAKKYGKVASWAVWDRAGDKAKSNISNMEVFDIEKNPSLLNMLRTNTVMVALNFSRDVKMEEPFLNFHDSNQYGQDYKIRYAFEGTEYYGSYMTDIIKDFPMLSSKEVYAYLKKKPDVIKRQLDTFVQELEFIGADRPVILAFGKNTYDLLSKNLCSTIYSDLIQLTHYSDHIGKEDYRVETHEKLSIKCVDS